MFGSIIQSPSDFISEALYGIALFLDSYIYRLVSFSYNLFLLTCKLNFGYLYDIVSPLVDRVKALIMVILVFKLAMMIIKFMINPEEAPSASKKTLMNILKVAALLVSYNFIFNILDDVSMIMIGTPAGYNYKAIGTIINVQAGKDDGVISRLIFGGETKIDEVGDFIAYNTLCVFIPDVKSDNQTGGAATCTELEKTITKDGKVYFGLLTKMKSKVGKTVEYWAFFDGIVGLYLIVCIIQAAVKVAIRMFKLMALQMIAPLAIITMIDDSKSKMGKFIATYTSVYLEVFIRIGSMLITTVFVSKFITNIKAFFHSADDAASGLTQGLLIIIVVVAAFKFVNDLPKFLEDSLGMKISGDGIGFGSFLKTLAGGAVGFAGGAIASGVSGNGFGRAMFDGAKGMIGGANAGNKSQGVADYFKKQANNIDNVAKGARGNWIEGYRDEDGNWVEGHYARPSMLESLRDSTGFGNAYRNKVERDKNKKIDEARQTKDEADTEAANKLNAEETARDAAQTTLEAAQKDQQTKVEAAQTQQRTNVEAAQKLSEEHADAREKERTNLQREMSEAQSGMQEAQSSLRQTMESNVAPHREEIKAQRQVINDQKDIDRQILDSMKNEDSKFKYRNDDGSEAAIKFGTSAQDFANRVVEGNKDIIASNAKIDSLKSEIDSGKTMDSKGNVVFLSDAEKAQKREELRAEIAHKDELTAKISSDAKHEFISRQNSDSHAGGTTVEQRQQIIANAQQTIETHEQQIVDIRNQYEQDKANLESAQQATNTYYQGKVNEMTERHRTEAIADRTNVQTVVKTEQAAVDKVRSDTQKDIDDAQNSIKAHNQKIKDINKAKQENNEQFERSKKDAERLAAQRLDGRRRRRPRGPYGGGPGNGNGGGGNS